MFSQELQNTVCAVSALLQGGTQDFQNQQYLEASADSNLFPGIALSRRAQPAWKRSLEHGTQCTYWAWLSCTSQQCCRMPDLRTKIRPCQTALPRLGQGNADNLLAWYAGARWTFGIFYTQHQICSLSKPLLALVSGNSFFTNCFFCGKPKAGLTCFILFLWKHQFQQMSLPDQLLLVYVCYPVTAASIANIQMAQKCSCSFQIFTQKSESL